MHTEDGHVRWTGKRAISINRRSYTYRQIAYAADRGHAPTGRVLTECDVTDCIHPQHITDAEERDERDLQRLAAAEVAAAAEAPLLEEPAAAVVHEEPRCGTPAAALVHEERGEELCDACWAAVSTAVRQLSRVGEA
ncbi:hypothetical protein AB0N17_03300 [Streptomyces sp. NPDC051133]|uniref:hypothetical protein n=1 Tax=Streptomyces sp. NPDC051133 TaxID=3155521 RepID=UPI00341CD6E7